MQETQVFSLIWEDLTWHGETKPVGHNYWTCALDQALACALQQEKPLKWEARHHN